MTRFKEPIGQGLQYRVYRLSKKRVLKVPTTYAQKLATLELWHLGKTKRSREAFARGTVRTLQKSLHGLQKIMRHIDASSIGNITFRSGMRYEQDYIEPLEKYIKSHSYTENKSIIDSYIDNVLQTWRCGFADTIFNFTINNGVVRNRAVLLDIGELTFSKNKIRSQLQKQTWLKQSSYMRLEDQRLKKYVKKEMRRRVTLVTLNKLWKADLST
jgi:hypothetical protein